MPSHMGWTEVSHLVPGFRLEWYTHNLGHKSQRPDPHIQTAEPAHSVGGVNCHSSVKRGRKQLTSASTSTAANGQCTHRPWHVVGTSASVSTATNGQCTSASTATKGQCTAGSSVKRGRRAES